MSALSIYVYIKSDNSVQIEHNLKKKKYKSNDSYGRGVPICPSTDNTEAWRRGYAKSIRLYTVVCYDIVIHR